MDTRGTNLPGWFGAFFLLCAIAGGIVVSCKTTEPPAGTQKDEIAGTEEGAALPRSSENPVAGEASIEQGAVVEIGKGEGEPPPSIEDGPIVEQAPAPPPAIEKEEAPEPAPAAPPVAEVADVPTETGSEIFSKVDSPLEDSRALALLDELNLHRPAVLPGKPAVSLPRKEKSDPGESQSAAKEASEEVKVPVPVVESLGPVSPAGNEVEIPEINTDVLAALNRMKAARGKVSSDPESAAEAGVSPEEKKEPSVSEPAPAAGERKEEPVLRGGEPAPKPAPVPAKAEPASKPEPAPAKAEPAPRPQGYITFKTLFHKGSTEAISFVERVKPDWIQKGHLSKVEGKKHSLVIFGETDAPTDPLTLKIVDMLDRYDQLDLDIKREVLRPKYVDARLAMDALLMSGICNVWQLTSSSDALTWKEGTKQRTLSRTTEMYVEKGGGIANSPLSVAPQIPFVYDMPSKDAVSMPTGYGGNSNTGSLVMTFDKSSSTEMRGGMMTVGTTEDLAKIKAFVETIDVPARRIMIEVQLIELEANKLTDLGIDSAQFGGGHAIGSVGLPLPGEAIVQPGVPGARAEGSFVPDVMNEGLKLLFDDTSLDIQGRFMAALHMLVREGEAKVRARPKILTLDDRVSALHLGRNVPTFNSTGVTRDTVNGNLINEVQSVGTVYSGITLHIRPRITGGADDRVALQLEVMDNQIVGRQRVFETDLAGIPEVIKRQYIGECVAHNHRPIILGGLIQEQEIDTVNKIPFISDIPYLGNLFRRTVTQKERREVIIVVTPHILSEEGIDASATPKESMHFDTFDSVLFNDRHILKGGDVLGLDPVNSVPAIGPDGKRFTEADVVDLTLLNIVKRRQLVTKLELLRDYLGEGELSKLTWMQRKWPERTVQDWPEGDKPLFFKVAAICIENLKELNPTISFHELSLPRREIVLPNSPYNITLSYDKVQRIQSLGLQQVFRGERVELEAAHVELVRRASGHSLRAFGDFLERQERKDGATGREAEDHGIFKEELLRLYRGVGKDVSSLKELSYTELFGAIEKENLSFDSIATFLETNMKERYDIEGAPDVGAFPADLDAFLKTTVSLKSRAKKLQDLEDRWRMVNTEEEDE
ncbi:MAG: hypothetical protein OSB83_14095 [Planctomycetota bacterium]|nr:hypothetical protein [Planctomycetota bacterium]